MLSSQLTIIALVASLVVAVLGSWYLQKFLKLKRSFELLDKILVSLVLYFVFGRLLGLVYYWDEVSSVGFALLPVTQPGNEILLFEQWPWIIFQITDSRMFLLEGLLAAIFGDIITSLGERSKRDADSRLRNQQYFFLVFAIVLIPLQLAQLVTGHLQSDLTSPQIFGVGLSIFAILIIMLLARTKRLGDTLLATLALLIPLFIQLGAVDPDRASGVVAVTLALAGGRFLWVAIRGTRELLVGRQSLQGLSPEAQARLKLFKNN